MYDVFLPTASQSSLSVAPIAMRTDVIDQALAMALHSAYDCKVAIVSVTMILCLAQSTESHIYVGRKEIVENMLKACEQKQKIVSEQSLQPQQRKKEDPVVISALKYVIISPFECSMSLPSFPLSLSLSLSLLIYLSLRSHDTDTQVLHALCNLFHSIRCYTSIVLAQIGLGSPHLLFDSIPPHLLQQIFNPMYQRCPHGIAHPHPLILSLTPISEIHAYLCLQVAKLMILTSVTP